MAKRSEGDLTGSSYSSLLAARSARKSAEARSRSAIFRSFRLLRLRSGIIIIRGVPSAARDAGHYDLYLIVAKNNLSCFAGRSQSGYEAIDTVRAREGTRTAKPFSIFSAIRR